MNAQLNIMRAFVSAAFLSVISTPQAAVDNTTPFASFSAFSVLSAGGSENVIYNTGNQATATVALGIRAEGNLNAQPNITGNASLTGLAFRFPDGSFRDAASPGCWCEGWGISAVTGTQTFSGFANLSTDGVQNLTASPPENVTSSSVTTRTTLNSLPGLQVTHAYAPAYKAPSSLFRATVTIKNTTGAALTDVKYVRVVDWDVPPTEFNEYVTIHGTSFVNDPSKRPYLETSHNNGFSSSNPLAMTFPMGDPSLTLNRDFTDLGAPLVYDHGAYFRFNLGDLAPGETFRFYVFYGAAGTETAALSAIADAGMQVYSLGQSNSGQATGSPATFILGFSGLTKYGFTGFERPVDNLPAVNKVNAGRAIPIKFSLSGNQGSDVLEPGYPKSVTVACDAANNVDTDVGEKALTAGNSELQYEASTNSFTYVWKTEKSWSGTCRLFTVRLNDGTDHSVLFDFR